MVFGWGKKKTQKQEPESIEPEEQQISFDKIPVLTDEIKALRAKTIVAETKSIRNDMDTDLSEIKNIVKELEKDNLNVDDIDKHLQILVVRGKELVISTIKNETKENLPEISKFENVLELNSAIGQKLKRIGDVLGRQSRVIHIFAKKYAEKLKGHLEILTSNHAELMQRIKSYKNLDEQISEILQKLNEYNNSEKNIEKLEKKISSLHKAISSLNDEIDSLQSNIDNLKSSENYLKYTNDFKNLEEFLKQKDKIKNEIDLQFTKISRPLGRYEYVSSLEKEQKTLLNKIISNPIDVLTSHNKADIITILSSVRKGVENGSISVKEPDKSLHSIDETIELIDGFIAKTSEFFSKKTELEKELEVFSKDELDALENNLIKANENKNDSESKIKTFENEISETKKKLPKLIVDIESLLQSISAKKYKIIL